MIPSREEIEKAVKFMKDFNKEHKFRGDTLLAISQYNLLSFAEAYLACEEPKEKTIYGFPDGDSELTMGDRGYNQALADSRLYLMKKCEGIEKFIENWAASENDTGGCTELQSKSTVVRLSEAIQSHLLGGDKT